MKTLIISACALAITLASCGEDKSETVIIERDTQSAPAAEVESDDSGLSFDLNSDEDGNVSGGVSGDVDLKKK